MDFFVTEYGKVKMNTMNATKKLCASTIILAGLCFSSVLFALPPTNEAAAIKSSSDTVIATAPAKVTGKVSAQPNAKFVCPKAADKTAVSCFVNAASHLYAVCSRVKAIEMNEFGYAQSEEGGNGFKSEFCREKQRATLPHYFDAAMKEATSKLSCEAQIGLDELHGAWQILLSGIRPQPDEAEADYRHRVDVAFNAFEAYQQDIQAAVTKSKEEAAAKAKAAKSKTKTKAKPAPVKPCLIAYPAPKPAAKAAKK
ncbi:MAG: hypothetical protein LBG61_05180 [Burkholderiales bacterium]|nr:hypothetical protein [Burkholderiales bacterium]